MKLQLTFQYVFWIAAIPAKKTVIFDFFVELRLNYAVFPAKPLYLPAIKP